MKHMLREYNICKYLKIHHYEQVADAVYCYWQQRQSGNLMAAARMIQQVGPTEYATIIY